MDALQAIETINSWRRILIDGDAEQLDRLLDDVERRLKQLGWTRDLDREARMATVGADQPSSRPSWGHDLDREAKLGGLANRENRRRCFVGGPEGGPRLMLGLSRVSDRRVRALSYTLLDSPSGVQVTDVARVVEDVIEGTLKPLASALGLKVTISRLGPNSRVPSRTAAALQVFSDEAAGAWPLSTDQERLWRRFVIQASREDAAFDIDELSDWFVGNGWSSEVAHSLIEKFMSDAVLISEYSDEIRA